MLKKHKITLLFIMVLGIFNIPNFSYSESQIGIENDSVIVEMSPNNPEPYQDVSIQLNSYSTDLNKAVITWDIDGDNFISGIGKINYSFKTKGPGITTNINISIKPIGSSGSITKRISINPSEVDILWESVDGYTPPFYKGKALPTPGSSINIVAIPNTDIIKYGIGSMTYTWKNDGSVLPESSGYNKNSLKYKNDIYSDTDKISVSVSSVEGNYAAEKNIEIKAFKPKVVFYKKSPTEGILYNNALNIKYTMEEDEMTIVGEPYFLSTLTNSDYDYSWKINGASVNTPNKKNELTVRPTARGGYATIGLKVENIKKIFQEASNQLKLSL